MTTMETLEAIFSLPKLLMCRPCVVKNFLSVSTVTVDTCLYGFIIFDSFLLKALISLFTQDHSGRSCRGGAHSKIMLVW